MHSVPLIVESYLFDDIIGCYIENDTFHLGSKSAVCTDKKFSQILVLPYRRTRMDIRDFSPHHNSFYSKRLHSCKLSKGKFWKRFRELSKDKCKTPKEEENVVR